MNKKSEAQKLIVKALAQHSAYLYRANTGASNDLISEFDKLFKPMLYELGDLLDSLTDPERKALQGANYTTPALKRIKKLVDDWTSQVGQVIPDAFAVGAIALASHELSYISQAIQKATAEPVTTTLTGEKVYEAALNKPVTGGQLIDDMMAMVSDQAQKTVWNTMRQGIADGQTNADIIKALKGKAEFKFQDSALTPTRRAIEMMVRTARNHISNTAYQDTYTALGVKTVVFVAVLDSRTSKQCASLDGTTYKADEAYPVPPLHPNCRSLIAPSYDGSLIGNRPAKGSDGTTQVNANTNFASWFANRSAAFQKEWLGPARYDLYKKGGYTIDRFVDPSMKPYTLNQLKMRDQHTFNEVFADGSS